MTKRALVLGIVLILIALLGFYLFRRLIDWTALAAIGTILAVIWAVFAQGILAWINRPILKIVGPYELDFPHLRRVPLRDQQGSQVAISYKISIQLKNTGGKIAKNAQPLISGMGRFMAGKWEPQHNWIAAPIRWDLDLPADIGRATPTEERDLVPHRTYPFSLGAVRTDVADLFILNTTLMPGNQDREYQPGEFCFKCAVHAEGAAPIEKFFHIVWDGGCTADFEEVKKRIKVYLKDHAPWKEPSFFKKVKKRIKAYSEDHAPWKKR